MKRSPGSTRGTGPEISRRQFRSSLSLISDDVLGMKISHLASEPRFENKSKTLRYVKVPLKLLYRINARERSGRILVALLGPSCRRG